MKKILYGVVAGLFTLPAMAADLPVKAPPMVAAPAPFNWTGFYVGGNFGGGWSNPNYLNTANTTFFGDVGGPPDFSHRIGGPIAGGQIGFNWQTGPVVFGAEAMFDAADIKGTVNPQRGGLPPLGRDDIFETRISSLFLGTARLGYAWNNYLLYAKGGYAGANVKVSVADTNGVNQGGGNASSWRSGWTIGGGGEFGLAPNWSLAVEYNYVRLPSASYELAGATLLPALYTFDVATRGTHLVTGRINYRFNWGLPRL